LQGLSGIALPFLWFAVFRNFSAALSQTVAVMLITFAAVILNYILTLWLVHGGWGLDPLGLFGAGLATSITSWLMFIALTLHVYIKPALRGYGVFKGRWKFNPEIFKEIFKLGIPVAALTLMEAGLFIATSILSGVIGAKTLAAYQVVMSWVGIPFVISFGFAEATMVRVAFAAGRQHQQAVRRAGLLGMAIVVGLTLLLVLVPLLLSETIIQIFINLDDPGYPDVSTLAAQLLIIAAIFQVFDGLQATAARALRGLKDNIAPLWIAGFGYWILGIGGGSLLAFKYNLGGVGLWWGLAAGLFVTSTLLFWRFHRFTSRPVQVGAPR
ncbi:MAG: MATE family efflux transporter, partial [Gammaproteobacteria bacterium]|nr:MATE family efflux transporter [Gammaproteobacteria bacterium]